MPGQLQAQLPLGWHLCARRYLHVFYELKQIPGWLKPDSSTPTPLQLFRQLTAAIRHGNLLATTQLLEDQNASHLQHLVKVSRHLDAAKEVSSDTSTYCDPCLRSPWGFLYASSSL